MVRTFSFRPFAFRRCGAGVLLVAGVLGFAGCRTGPSDDLKRAVAGQYAEVVRASYEDARDAAVALNETLQAFAADPTPERLQKAKASWLAAREPYGQTEAYRFYGGPIDDENGPEILINAWPMDEAYVDYVEGDPDAGIINRPDDVPELTPAVLVELNEREGEESIATGFHAIEFLLWGQDFFADSPGRRSHADYLTGAEATAPNAGRRARYLLTTGALLVEHLNDLVEDWADGDPSNYRAAFVEGDPDEAVRRLLVGLGSLSGAELAGERMTVPYETRDQEDEHSCFSDNTHRDIVANVLGIRNVYLGTYRRVNGSMVQGPGLDALVRAVDPALADRIVAQLDETLVAAEAIQAPFDQEILGADTDPGRVRVRAVIDHLRVLTGLFAEAAAALGIQLNLEA